MGTMQDTFQVLVFLMTTNPLYSSKHPPDIVFVVQFPNKHDLKALHTQSLSFHDSCWPNDVFFRVCYTV